MHIIGKTLNKIYDKVFGKADTTGRGLSSEVPSDDLVCLLDGSTGVIDDMPMALSVDPAGGNSEVLQREPTALVGDGVGYGTFDQAIVLEGDFEISWKMVYNSAASDQTIISGTDYLEGALWINSDATDTLMIYHKTLGDFNTIAFVDGTTYDVNLIREGIDLTLTVNGVTEDKTWNADDVIFRYTGHYPAGAKPLDSNLWDLTINGTTWPMCNVGEDNEFPNSGNNYITWSSFTGDPVQEVTTGSNWVNERGWSEYENLLLNSAFEGAVSGTPGTRPDDFSSPLTNGTLTVIGNSLNVSCIAGRHIYDQAVALDVGVYYLNVTVDVITPLVVASAFYIPAFPTGSSSVYYVNGEEQEIGYVLPVGENTIQIVLTTVNSGSITLRFGVGATGSTSGDITFSEVYISTSALDPYVKTTGAPVTGIQPAGFQSYTDRYEAPHPLAGLAGYPCVKGDGVGYFQVPIDLPVGDYLIELNIANYGGSAWQSIIDFNSVTSSIDDDDLPTILWDSVMNIHSAIGSINSVSVDGVGTNVVGDSTFHTIIVDSTFAVACDLVTINATYEGGLPIKANGKALNVKVTDKDTGTLVHHWIAENTDSDTERMQDLVGGNDALLVGASSLYSTTYTKPTELGYGSEVNAGGFSDWDIQADGFTLEDSNTISMESNTGYCQKEFDLTVDKSYSFSIDVSDITEGNYYIWVDGSYQLSAQTKEGTITHTWTQSSSDNFVKVVCGAFSTLTVANPSIKEITQTEVLPEALQNGYGVDYIPDFEKPELVTNGTFDEDLTGWVDNGEGTISAVGKQLSVTNTGVVPRVYNENAIPVVSGEIYEITFDNPDSNGGFIHAGTAQGVTDIIANMGLSTTGSFSYTIAVPASTLYLQIGNAIAGTATFDNISIKRVNNLVENGEFSSDREWTKGTGWSIASGVATATTLASRTNIDQDECTDGVSFYKTEYTISSLTAGQVRIILGGASGTWRTANGTYTEIIQANSNDSVFIQGDTGFSGSVDNVIIQEVIPGVTVADSDGLMPDGITEAPYGAISNTLATEYPGPITPNQKLGGFACVEGDGVGYFESSRASDDGDFNYTFAIIPDTSASVSSQVILGSRAGGILLRINASGYPELVHQATTVIYTHTEAVTDGQLTLIKATRVGNTYTLQIDDGLITTSDRVLTISSFNSTVFFAQVNTDETTTTFFYGKFLYADLGDGLFVAENTGSSPEIMQDIVGHQDAIGQSISGTLYTTTDLREDVPKALANGYSEDWTYGEGYTDLGYEILENGGFDTDTDWAKGTGWSIAGGVASCDGSQTAPDLLSQTGILTVGTRYRIQLDITLASGTLQIYAGATISPFYDTSGTVSTDIICTTNTNFHIWYDADFVGSIDNVSVKEYITTHGPERITNGSFDEDISGWNDGSSANSYIEWLNGTLNAVYVDGTVRFNSGFPTTIGKVYSLSIDRLNTCVVSIGNSPGSGDISASSYGTGVWEATFTAESTTTYVNGYNGASYAVDNVTVREVFEFVENGTFDTDTTGWSAINSTIEVDTGKLKVTSTAAYGYAYQAIETVAGSQYKLSIDVQNGTSGSWVQIRNATVGGTIIVSDTSLANESAEIIFTAVSISTVVILKNLNSPVGAYSYFDNVSVREHYPGVTVADSQGLMPDQATGPDYLAGDLDGFYNLPGLTWIPTGPEVQAVLGVADVDWETIEIIDDDVQVFAGSEYVAVYSEPQDIYAEAAGLECGCLGDQLITNGGFDSASDWIISGGSSISGGEARVYSSAGASSYIHQIIEILQGDKVMINTNYNHISGVSKIQLGSAGSNALVISDAGEATKAVVGEYTVTDYNFFLSRADICDTYFDNVSVRKLTRE